jgi:hypothetical protein
VTAAVTVWAHDKRNPDTPPLDITPRPNDQKIA